MGGSTVHREAQSVNITVPSGRAFFLIHGYTGSPTDFNGLPKFLSNRFNASVQIPRLIGHGTELKDLDALETRHFVSQVEAEFRILYKQGKEIVLGGHSFGGQLALYLAGKYPVAGIFTTGTPYVLRMPLGIPFVTSILQLKKSWTKYFPQSEIFARANASAFYYSSLPSYGLRLVNDLNHMITPLLPHIRAPILTIHSENDIIADRRSSRALHALVGSHIKEDLVLRASSHGIFYSTDREAIPERIASILERNTVFS